MTCVSLPSELVMEIMSRVPGKSLARFRSVSKHFNSLLSDPCFLRLHHSRSRYSIFTLKAVLMHESSYYYQQTYNLFVTNNKANGLVHEFDVDFRTIRMRMLSSHHQLICFVCEYGIHLCDPVNKELRNLPNPPFSPWCNFNNPGECLVSFGFVDATRQYKVIKWPHDLDEDRTRRLPSGLITTWKKVDLKFEVLIIHVMEYGCVKVAPWTWKHTPCPYLLQLSSQVYVNGFIYWTTSDFQIVSFSLQDETFSTVSPKPPCFRLDTQGISQKSRFFTLSGSRRNLWMVDYHVPSQIMEIWKMEESRGSWAKVHKIDLGGTHPNDNDGKVEMLDIRSDQVVFKLLPRRLLICYDANTNTLKNYERESIEYYDHLCHSTDGLLSIHNLDMFNSRPHHSIGKYIK
ncbi:F-box/LRR-repeat protein [Cardamine amara subsp. amara]|uniref:F-box/LRR-repeat protein n=1 Tax=Cardamine amara subsp. amara TaxID=228776 RepID=A0ABD1ACB6_CARAN